MAFAFVVTLEKELPQAMEVYVKTASGRAIARETDRLDSTARRKNVAPLTGLLSESQTVLAAKMREQGFDPSKMRLPPEVWFEAAEGVKTIKAVAEYVAANLNDFKQPNPILRDLKAAEELLAAADSAKVKFHFTKTAL